MPFAEFANYDALGLAGLVRAKQLSPLELVDEAIRRIEAHNPKLNAVIYKTYDLARQAAQNPIPDGPFRGVPFLLKDIISTLATTPTSGATRLLKDIPQPQDSELVTRYKKAGLLIVGKTNLSEFGMFPVTEPEVFGPTHNPWDLARSPGGSSGGSAAAVASHMVPMAEAADGGGSIRTPASCCGLFGLKPTRGRMPTGPDAGELWRGFTIQHAITRSVRDSAAMLDATSGMDVGAPYACPQKARPFLEEAGTAPGRLRIAFTSRPFLGKNVHSDCREGLAHTAGLLERLGHEVIEDAPQIDAPSFRNAYITILAAEIRIEIENVARIAKRPVQREDFEAPTYVMGLLGKAMHASDYAAASAFLQSSSRRIGEFFERYDVLLTPTVSVPPPMIGEFMPSGIEGRVLKLTAKLGTGWPLKALGLIGPIAAETFEFIPYVPIFNVTGQPAMSVPLIWNATGLPVGMHFAGRFGDEATLFRLAGQLEREQPWFEHGPPGY